MFNFLKQAKTTVFCLLRLLFNAKIKSRDKANAHIRYK
jgi:hypothetical protein